MAPKKSGGAGSSREQKEMDWARWKPIMAFYPPGMTLEGTARVARMAATDYNEHGATVCRPATITTNDPRDARLFMCFVAAGWSRPHPSSSSPWWRRSASTSPTSPPTP